MSRLEPWPELREERLVHYKVFDVRRSYRRSPRTGGEVGFFLIRTLDWVNVVACTPDEQMVFVRQYRQGSERFSLELPGGAMDGAHETPAAAAARELREETGYAAGSIRQIGVCNPNPALFTNRIATFLALDCERQGDLIQDPGEDMEVVLMPLSEVEARVRTGEIDHALVLAGLYYYRLLRA
jgi:8-oxo-dGTP pyrophosphatase MutT (NUDIX family)